ncbi:iron-sulfur cluster assembly scaffold protein [Spiroplasma alleghenense]|uniref:FeS assembly protein n=1 Tax=Spiroplasma alleghenense TaxID=216931 RepID=A0A345Z3Z0_9MOLU|nr:iron-sulfur cluster assembly scaffold protein [Spiroplasma alleghenense]AXK51319.1 FeS assembly protein [Spiroplasma alleghenense]
MLDKNDKFMLRQIIMQHFVEANNKGLSDNLNSIRELQKSQSCSDEITIEMYFENDRIKFAKWDGSSCAISSASTDILADQLENKTYQEGLEILTNFHNLIKNEKYDEEQLGELIAFINVAQQGNRIPCALLGANGFKNMIVKKMEENNETTKTN